MGRWSQFAGKKFLDWLDPPKGLHWLDVGCGNGAFTDILIERTAPSNVDAIDPSESQIAHACSRPGSRMANFRIGSALEIPFDKAEFDAVAMALAITFVPDPVKAFAEMARVARPAVSSRRICGTYLAAACPSSRSATP